MFNKGFNCGTSVDIVSGSLDVEKSWNGGLSKNELCALASGRVDIKPLYVCKGGKVDKARGAGLGRKGCCREKL